MSQRLGEWWRASQQRSDPRTIPEDRQRLYEACRAALRPAQARSAPKATRAPHYDPDACTAALRRWYDAQRRADG